MIRPKSARFYRVWAYAVAVLLLALAGCRSAPGVTIKSFGPVEAGGRVEVKKGIGIAVEVDNAENLPLTYRWITTRGTVRVSSDIAPAGTYEASGTPGTETITVQVMNGNTMVAEKSIQIEVVAAIAQEPPPPPPPPTATPTPRPTDTHTPPPTPTHTPTPAPTETLTPPPTKPPVAAAPTAASTPCLAQAPLLSPLPGSVAVITALRTDQAPEINGCLDEEIWSQAQPLTYAVHPPANDSTTMTVRLLWDDKYLYAGFDVSDTQVEESSLDNVWDGDSVGVIIKNGGKVQEYRFTMRGATTDTHTLDPDRAGTTNSQAILKGATTLNNPDDQDEGYTVEMRIPWEIPPTAGSMIDADLWSIDHDYNPGKRYDDPDTVHFGISWDGDRNVTTARKSILLSNTPTPNIIELDSAYFETQDADGDGIDDEFLRFTTYEKPDLLLPIQDGIDLSDYALEFTFQGADGREVKVWYKSRPDWNNVVSLPYTINSDQPTIRYDPFADGRSQDDPEFDFTHIWAIGANVSGGVEGVQLSSARLINREAGISTLPPPADTPAPTEPTSSLISVLNVKDGETVAQRLSLVGEYAPEVSDDIWVLVGLLDDRLYPQSPNACTGQPAFKLNGHWEVPIGVGNPGDADAKFEIIVTTANIQDSQFLAQTVQTWCQNNNYPGLPRDQLPASLKEHQHLTVTRANEQIGPHPPLSNTELPGQLSITSLHNGDPAPQSFFLSGAADSSVAEAIWVLIYNPNGRFYPQSSNACENQHTIRSDNLWQVPISLGGPDDVGKPFDIIAVLVDADANAFFEQKQQEWCQANSYSGFLAIELPPGLDEKASIRVIRQ